MIHEFGKTIDLGEVYDIQFSVRYFDIISNASFQSEEEWLKNTYVVIVSTDSLKKKQRTYLNTADFSLGWIDLSCHPNHKADYFVEPLKISML